MKYVTLKQTAVKHRHIADTSFLCHVTFDLKWVLVNNPTEAHQEEEEHSALYISGMINEKQGKNITRQ